MKTFARSLQVLVLMWVGSPAVAQNVTDENLYVQMGQFWTHHHGGQQTAYMFKENNGELFELPNNTDAPTSQFRIMDLIDGVDENDVTWFIGVTDIRIIERENGRLFDRTDQWQYTETVHHMVVKMNPVVTARSAVDPCGNRIWPIATGSELTPYQLDLAGPGNRYAMYWQGGDELVGAAWHFNNPGGLAPGKEIFIRFTLRFDLNRQASYRDVNVSWIRGGGGCSYDFCLTPGEDQSVGPMFTVPRRARLVMAFPHLHDHALEMKLFRRSGRRYVEILGTTVNNSRNFTAAHHCPPDGEMVPAHAHTSRETGHLPVRGLADQVWYDANQTLNAGDGIFAAAVFDVPNHDPSYDPGPPIDAMAIYILFWTDLE